MRMIDKNRFIATQEIKIRGDAITSLSKEYERTYKDKTYTPTDQQDILDALWRLITENQIRLTEILRENGR